MRHFWSLASKRVVGPAPLLPARMFFQLVSTSPPSGVTRPRPVTTTRRIAHSLMVSKTNGLPIGSGSRRAASQAKSGGRRPRSGLVLVDIFDRVLDRRDLLGGVVGDLDPELFLEGHHQL